MPARTFPELPDDAAVAAVDAKAGRAGGSGVAMVSAGRLGLHARREAPVPDAWLAMTLAAGFALDVATASGVRRLRLLVENPELARILDGKASDRLQARAPVLVEALDRAAGRGLATSAMLVLGGTETSDLPSRLNDLAHVLAGLGARGEDWEGGIGLCPRWEESVLALRADLGPTRLPERRGLVLSRKGAAAFLGFDPGTVDALVRAGHIELSRDGTGVTRASVARVHEAAQDMRTDAYFGSWEESPAPSGP